MNSSPAASVRVSIDTPLNSRAASPATIAPPPIAGDPAGGQPNVRPGPATARLTRRRSWSAGAPAPRAPPRRRRTAATRSPITWYFSCPLPATSTRSPGRASSIAFAIAAPRSTIASDRCPLSRAACRAVMPALDLFDDAVRILAARVVRRHDDEVAQPAGDRAHQRTLRAIAIAAAAEHRDQPAARQRPRRLEQVAQRVVGVRVVDDDGHFVAGAGHDLEAAGHAVERCTPRSIASNGRSSAVAVETAARML